MHPVIQCYCCIIVLCSTACLAVAGEPHYRDAKTSEPVFDHDTLGLMGIEREKLADELAAYVSNEYAKETKGDGKQLEFASRMLGVAIQLQARNRTAIVANFKLLRGMKTEPVKAEYQPEVLAEYLYTRSKLLMEQGGDQNALLASYLLEFSVEIDPTNEDAIYDLELRAIEGKPIDWTRLYRPDEQSVTGEKRGGEEPGVEEPVAHSEERGRQGN